MNIFIIPSWYPTKSVPIGGIFVKEQSMAMAELSYEDNIIVSKWDNGYTNLPIKNPLLIPLTIHKFLNSKIEDNRITNNFYEFYTPTLTWSKRVPFGGHSRIYNSIKASFLRAKQKFGKIDIIHAHVSYPAGYIASMLSSEFKIPYIMTEHMSPFPFKSLMNGNQPIDEIITAFKNAKRTIAVSTSLLKRIQSFGLPCSDVVPNLIDDIRFTPSDNKNMKFTFFTLCGISEQKGIDTLLYAIQALENHLKNKVNFVIGGGGGELENYKKLALSLSLNNVKWLGPVRREEAPALFQSSHAFIMLSRHETFGIVYAEALATGIPVIATECGGPEDIINDINGVLIKMDSPEQAAKAIKEVFTHYSHYDSKVIRADFENRFSKIKFVDKMKKIYQEAVACAE